jgi:ubiquinone/menaquinone biosynthesis C-methylase UbiE
MARNDKERWARDTAVTVHDYNAAWFDQQYNKFIDHYGSDFLYGRRQIDFYFNKTINKLPQNSRILDLGCGTGEKIAELIANGFKVWGIEPSINMRKYAESKLPPGTVTDGSILNIPFPDNYFDFVYATEVLRYLNHDDNVTGLKEIYRVLKPGGIFFGTFVNRYAADGFAIITNIRKIWGRISGKAQLCHVEFETPKKLRSTLCFIGFNEVEIHGAMIAFLRIIYKINNKLGRVGAKLMEPYDKIISDDKRFRYFAGHLVGIAKKL